MRSPKIAKEQQRLDNLFAKISIEYAQNKATPQVTNFVENRLKKFQNPRMEKVFQLMASFDEEWSVQLRNRTDGEIKDAVDGIVNLRNSIAHGRSVGITYITINNYYQSSKKLLDVIEDILGSNK